MFSWFYWLNWFDWLKARRMISVKEKNRNQWNKTRS
jgi:hypothetical protein